MRELYIYRLPIVITRRDVICILNERVYLDSISMIGFSLSAQQYIDYFRIKYQVDIVLEYTDPRAFSDCAARKCDYVNMKALLGEPSFLLALSRAKLEVLPMVCECGGEKNNWGHSNWCPKFIMMANERSLDVSK